MNRRTAITTLFLSCACIPAALAQAPDVNVVDSAPKAHAKIGTRSSEFYVRFDRPVDHIKSRLVIRQAGREIEVLHPRLESAPEVLFARAPTLAAGDYTLHWSVVTLQGARVVQGDIPFKVGD